MMLFDPLTVSLLLGYLLDLMIGDPVYPLHPVRVIGRAANSLEMHLRGKFGREFLAGLIFAVLIVFASTCITWAVVFLSSLINPYLSLAFSTFFIYSSISVRDLIKHALSVKNALIQGDVVLARKRVSLMVSRRTENLSENEIICAVIESVSENTVDGIISPLFYASIFGAPGAMGYKAASTLDSMIGYKDERYINFGRASARLDDALSFIPARLSVMIFTFAALLCGKNPIRTIRIVFRDRGKSASPNAGIPMAAIAGALNIRLGGAYDYDGKKEDKPEFGGDRRELRSSDIDSCIRLTYVSSFLALLLVILFRIGILTLLLPRIRP
ncbi:MAG: adenosylcobinamide-phosphate synthase CbiB [Actinobacteria bacterium]|nr:adenosylcobinamide-phosphate synthase CbiB [Actinomycetota bacterium]